MAHKKHKHHKKHQQFEIPTHPHNKVGRAGHKVSGVPWYSMAYGIGFGGYGGYYGGGYYGEDPDHEHNESAAEEAAEHGSGEANEGIETGGTTSVGDGTSAAGGFGAGPV